MFGPPGVGKTTLHRELQKRMSHLDPHPSLKAPECAEHHRYHAWIANFMTGYLFSRCDALLAAKRVKWTLDVYRHHQRCKSKSGCGFALVDDGFCQRGQSLYLSNPPSDRFVDRYFDLMPKPDAVLILNASEELVAHRLQKRFEETNGVRAVRIADYKPTMALIESKLPVLRARMIRYKVIDTEDTLRNQTESTLEFLSS